MLRPRLLTCLLCGGRVHLHETRPLSCRPILEDSRYQPAKCPLVLLTQLDKMHVEYMLKTSADVKLGSRLVQRRFGDFQKLGNALASLAKRAGTTVPPLPTSLTFGRDLSSEFAAQRQASLQTWITRVVACPPFWCDALRLFLGLQEDDPPGSAIAPDGGGGGGGGSGGGGSSSALVVAGEGSSREGSSASYSAELVWISQRAQQPGVGVLTEGTGFFRAETLVRWLATQALVTSREQAVPLGEAMRRQGLLRAVGEQVPFTDGAALYRFVPQSTS